MKIETTPQIRRFNKAIEEGDKETFYGFDRCEAKVLSFAVKAIGWPELAREINEAAKDLKNGGEK